MYLNIYNHDSLDHLAENKYEKIQPHEPRISFAGGDGQENHSLESIKNGSEQGSVPCIIQI